MFESGQKWAGDIPGGPEVIERPSRRSGSDREALPEVWEWSGGSPRVPGVVGSPS